MTESDRLRVEANAREGCSSVKRVAEDGKTFQLGVGADLVGASGERSCGQKVPAGIGAQIFELRFGIITGLGGGVTLAGSLQPVPTR